MHYVAAFFAGAFLCNCIPHLDCGLRGAPFPTPFAKPRGIGDSSPLINVLWGFFIGVASRSHGYRNGQRHVDEGCSWTSEMCFASSSSFTALRAHSDTISYF